MLNEIVVGIGQHLLGKEINTHIPSENTEESVIINTVRGVYNFFKSCCGLNSNRETVINVSLPAVETTVQPANSSIPTSNNQ